MYILGIDPTKVHESQDFSLGARGLDHLGREFVFVKASTALAQFDASIIHETFNAAPITTTLAAPGTGTGKKVGVPLVAIALDSFGWLCVNGAGSDVKVNVAASCVKFTLLYTTATAGVLDDTTTAVHAVRGLVIDTTATGADSITAVLTNPYVGTTL